LKETHPVIPVFGCKFCCDRRKRSVEESPGRREREREKERKREREKERKREREKERPWNVTLGKTLLRERKETMVEAFRRSSRAWAYA